MNGRPVMHRLSDVLAHSHDQLASLRRRAAYLQRLQAAVEATLPPAARDHVRAADYSDQRLLLLVDSSAWATRLRYQQRAIIRGLAQRLRLGVTHVEVRVRPWSTDVAPATQPRRLTPETRRLIRSCAGSVEDNPPLARALRRLAEAGRD